MMASAELSGRKPELAPDRLAPVATAREDALDRHAVAEVPQ